MTVTRERRHPERLWRKLGPSLWFILWALDNTTQVEGGLGIVRDGRPVRDSEIAAAFGGSAQLVFDWRRRLRGRFIHAQLATPRTDGFVYQVDLAELKSLGIGTLFS